MKLEGSLDAFSLPDVFQLLSLTKKSGGLHLTDGQATGMVYFAGGSITGAVSDVERQALARRLVGLGAVDDSALRRAVERATTDGSGVTRALLEAGAVDAALVQGLALEQAVNAKSSTFSAGRTATSRSAWVAATPTTWGSRSAPNRSWLTPRLVATHGTRCRG